MPAASRRSRRTPSRSRSKTPSRRSTKEKCTSRRRPSKRGQKKKVIVIGAGPSGLVAAKTLVEHGFDAVVLEAGNVVGGTFANKTYDDGRLVSSRFITAFSDLRMEQGKGKGEDPDHPSIERYLAYLERYCEAFKLWPRIRFGCSVSRVERFKRKTTKGVADDVWQYEYDVHYTDGDGDGDGVLIEHGDAVCVCSGLHNVPFVPAAPGLACNSSGGSNRRSRSTLQVLHSSTYKEKSVFRGKRVLVVGCGETGLDLTYRAIKAPATSVDLVVRRGFLSVPTVLKPGVPLDSYITNMCECSYVHRWVEKSKMKWHFTTPFIRGAFLFATGSSVGFNQWAGGFEPHKVQRGHHIINKSTAALPWINRPVKRRAGRLGKLFSWWDWRAPEGDGRPDVNVLRTSPVGLADNTHKTVRFADGTTREYDVVVWATGYKQRFPFLFSRDEEGKTTRGGSELDDDPLPNERNICSSEEPTLSFIGFVRPNVGAIPPMSELQVFWWIQRLRGRVALPLAPPTWHLLGCERTNAYACDYGAYMHDVARDIGAIPSVFSWLLRDPRVAVSYALGQAYCVFFRLEGPFATPQAREIARTELLAPVVDRGVISNLLFLSIIVLFGWINGVSWLLDHALVRPVAHAMGRRGGDGEKTRKEEMVVVAMAR